MIKALFIPFLIFVAIEYFLPVETVENKKIILTTGTYILLGFSLLISILMAVLVHRILLLDEECSFLAIFRFSKREISFILKSFGLILLLAIITFILILAVKGFSSISSKFLSADIQVILAIILIALVLITIISLFTRISLVFPSIAIDKPLEFSEAIKISKNYKLFIFLTVFLIPGFLSSLIGFAYGLVIDFLSAVVWEELRLLYALLNIFTTVLVISFLSTTYEYIISQEVESSEDKQFLKEGI